MLNLLYIVLILWVGWLLLDGLVTKSIWVKGGAKDRFTRSLDMSSFAHKVHREDNAPVYWISVVLYSAFIVIVMYLIFFGE